MTLERAPTFTGHDPQRQPMGPVSRAGQKLTTVYVECTHTYHSDINTGIQRVVRNIMRHGPEVAARFGMRIVPVIVENSEYRVVDSAPVLNGKLSCAKSAAPAEPEAEAEPPPAPPVLVEPEASWKRLLKRRFRGIARGAYLYLRTLIAAIFPFRPVTNFLLAPPSEFGLHRMLRQIINFILRRQVVITGPQIGHENDKVPAEDAPKASSSEPPEPVDHTGDILLLLDSSWTEPLWPATKAFKQQGGTVVGVIYDLIPVSHPHACVPQLTAAFTDWLREYCTTTDGTIAISHSVERQYQMYLELCFAGKQSILQTPTTFFHLGSDLDLAGGVSLASARISAILETKMPTFLMVGSIEPRKNHAFVLDAFDRLWDAGHHVRLIIIGKQAWRTESFLDRVDRHPQLDESLIVLRDASDAELEQCYLGSDALIIASEIEGFGLPIVEAFRRELPVICSDIPVFREIGGDAVDYFDLEDPASLTELIANFGQPRDHRSQTVPTWLTWHQSAIELLESLSKIVDRHASNPRQAKRTGSDRVA